MRLSDVDFILVPRWLAGSKPAKPDDDHWISRWQRNIASARWLDADGRPPADALLAQAESSTRPVVVITHDRGVNVLLQAGVGLEARPVVGAFIVAPSPSSTSNHDMLDGIGTLAFPSVLVAPNDHPEFHPTEAERLAGLLGGHFVDAGATGRIDSASGQGPWPEGLMRLGWFLKQLSVK